MRSAERAKKILDAIRALPEREVSLMEVCGTHTMAIAEAGIRSLLPPSVKLLSGPGCPVCVTPPEEIDAVLALSAEPDVILTSYGDMLRVPGSTRGDSLLRRRALGADVRVVYSPVDAVKIAEENPQKEVVFLGVGFETTAPGTAAAVRTAAEKDVKNFSVLSLLKSVEPAIRALLTADDVRVDGFLCPGHVATIIGKEGFRFLPEEYRKPAVISGFEAEDILLSVYCLLQQILEEKPRIQNEYRRAVVPEGNLLAKQMIRSSFTMRPCAWRGLGTIENSGFRLTDELAAFDAEKCFSLQKTAPVETGCRCGDVITGRIAPVQCPFFGNVCTPEDPIGPCMVSTEGACAAAYKYQEITEDE